MKRTVIYMGIISTMLHFFGCSGLKNKDGGKNKMSTPSETSTELHKNRPVYLELTEEIIDATPDINLLHTIFDHLSAKLPGDNDKKYEKVMSWNTSRQTIYMLWVVKAEMNKGGYSQFHNTPNGRFHPHLPDAFRRIGVQKFADLTERANNILEEKNETSVLDELDNEFYALYETENLRQRQVDFIREHKEDFVDK